MRLIDMLPLLLLFAAGTVYPAIAPLPIAPFAEAQATLATARGTTTGTTTNTLTDADNGPVVTGQDVVDTGATGQTPGISPRLYVALERLSRLVDIAYCVGSTGLWHPFSCASRCKEFPSLDLITTWNTGVLMSDSCGYVAVDRGGGLLKEDPAVSGGASGDDDGAIIVAFRGTYSVTNTVVDLSTVPQKYVPYPTPPDDGDDNGGHGDQPASRGRCANCTVHMGFLASWEAARQTVLPTLRALRAEHPRRIVHLVGHSLGGAVAALAALELRAARGWDGVVVTTFGEPRVGNDAFVQYLDAAFELQPTTTAVEGEQEKRSFRRLTHADDPVPLLPLAEWGYRSHAGEIFISKPGLAPEPFDMRLCAGDYDPDCIAGSEGEEGSIDPLAKRAAAAAGAAVGEGRPADPETDIGSAARRRGGGWGWGVPARLKLWQLFFAHRDYFWRLGLCVPGGDPIDWGRQGRGNSAMEEDGGDEEL